MCFTHIFWKKHKNNEDKDRFQTELHKSYERTLKSLPIVMIPVLFLIFGHNKHVSVFGRFRKEKLWVYTENHLLVIGLTCLLFKLLQSNLIKQEE